MAKLRQDTREAVSRIARQAVSSNCQRAEDFPEQYWLLYRQTLDALWRDPALGNRSYSEISGDLFSLLDDVIEEKDKYSDRKTLHARVAEAINHLVRKTEEYEVVMVVEALSLPSEITIGRTTFVHFDTAQARAWGMDAKPTKSFEEYVIGRTVGIVRVDAGSFDKAWELASQELDTSLSILRLAMASCGAMAPTDYAFLQHRGSAYVTKKLGAEPVILSGVRRGFAPVMLDLREQFADRAPVIAEAARGLGTQVSALYDRTLSAGLSSALLRALEWMGSSITRESYDDKIVDLCTAMECMLTVESDRFKGEAIAFRYFLVSGWRGGGDYLYPWATLPAYRLRSQVVHGAGLRVAGEEDYGIMREVALRTFSLVLDLVKTKRELTSVAEVIRFLENDPRRVEFAMWTVGDRRKDDREVQKYAREVLARIAKSSGGGGVNEDTPHTS